jgi:hypothetical protein
LKRGFASRGDRDDGEGLAQHAPAAPDDLRAATASPGLVAAEPLRPLSGSAAVVAGGEP